MMFGMLFGIIISVLMIVLRLCWLCFLSVSVSYSLRIVLSVDMLKLILRFVISVLYFGELSCLN